MLYTILQERTVVKERWGGLHRFDVQIEAHKPAGGGHWYVVKHLESDGSLTCVSKRDRHIPKDRMGLVRVQTHSLEHARKVFDEFINFKF